MGGGQPRKTPINPEKLNPYLAFLYPLWGFWGFKWVPFQNRAKNPQLKWYHFRKGSKIIIKSGTIWKKFVKFSKKWYGFWLNFKISQQKMVPFKKRFENPQQKWYHFRKVPKIFSKNGTISEKGWKSSTKMVGTISEKGRKSSTKNGTISEKYQKSSAKMVPFQKRVENRQQKWYHFR